MKLVYEASNALEARMVFDLLVQGGLSGRIDGEYLQGGVGEIHALGVVRVLVEEEDFDTAKAIIRRWDAREFAITEDEPVETDPFTSP